MTCLNEHLYAKKEYFCIYFGTETFNKSNKNNFLIVVSFFKKKPIVLTLRIIDSLSIFLASFKKMSYIINKDATVFK